MKAIILNSRTLYLSNHGWQYKYANAVFMHSQWLSNTSVEYLGDWIAKKKFLYFALKN